MRFIPVTGVQRTSMLRAVGVSSVDDLFDVIPENVRLDRPLALEPGMAEEPLVAHLRELAAWNLDAGHVVSFLGAGCYDHYVPSLVGAVVSKPEFFTAYTPYQAEISQGTLQAIYEFQTMVCELSGMDVANASMYDGATAFVEGAYLAAHATRRRKVVVSGAVHPDWLATLRTYAAAGLLDVEVVPYAEDHTTPLQALRAAAEGAAAVMLASPNFFGCVEDVRQAAEAAHEAGALLVAGFAPALAGVLASPGSLGADVAVAEGQPLGNAMSFGGPGLGLFACREEHVRRMPGRIVGRTVDVDGRAGFALTMQTREQHIRREKATSNICSNHSLNALAAGAHLAALGANGLRDLGVACVSKARYLREKLLATGRFERVGDAPFGHEFVLRYVAGDAEAMLDEMLQRGYLGGLHLERFWAEERGHILFCATEKRTRAEIDAFAEEVASL